jgi:sensor histidine kinase regulating citrate/malate metabolism
MSETDVYSLFGNIFDNAIEAVSKLDEKERSIGFSIKRSGNFVAINIYNGYAGQISFANGLPITDKKNKNYHGFGIKSVRYVVDKYGGEMQINAQDGVFDLTLLFTCAEGEGQS